MVWGIAYVLHYFVALRAEPTRRALWIVGIPYALTALAFMFYLPSIGGRLVSPIALGLLRPLRQSPVLWRPSGSGGTNSSELGPTIQRTCPTGSS